MNDIHIVTVATESKYYFPYLKESCKRHGKELEVLGFGEKWRGFNMKFKLMIDYLKKLPENDIVCFVDGYDVLCVRELNDLKSEFIRLKNNHNCKIIVGEDKFQFEFCKYFITILFGKCNDKHINSGTYIGYSKDILDILQQINNEHMEDNKDDQKILIEYCQKNTNDIHIDSLSELFFTKFMFLQEINNLVINDNKIFFDNQKPFFIHANGGGFLDDIIIKLGYTYDNNNRIKDKIFMEIINEKLMKGMLANYILYFILFVSIIIIIYILYKINILLYLRKFMNKRIIKSKIT